ncbi:hypothetical protein E4U22_007789, partial [Claviceps purpurea]
MDIIARISSKIFLGDQLCRNEEWLQITKNYTTCFSTAATKLRMFPRHLRILAHWFLPECRKLRQEQQEASAAGTTFDPVIFQLTLSLLAIHTTFDLLQQTMIELGQRPEFLQPLRDEIQQSLLKDGWKKTSIFNMKLLDSAIKEAQRLKPSSILTTPVSTTVTMRRYVLEDLQLSNGLVVKKGTRLNVDNQRLVDPSIYDHPDVYNPYRFYDMRSKPGKDHIAQLVSTSPDHLGFGHGEHSCPGRFFAANEIKVALCHILMKYDWKLAPFTVTRTSTHPALETFCPEAPDTTRSIS